MDFKAWLGGYTPTQNPWTQYPEVDLRFDPAYLHDAHELYRCAIDLSVAAFGDMIHRHLLSILRGHQKTLLDRVLTDDQKRIAEAVRTIPRRTEDTQLILGQAGSYTTISLRLPDGTYLEIAAVERGVLDQFTFDPGLSRPDHTWFQENKDEHA